MKRIFLPFFTGLLLKFLLLSCSVKEKTNVETIDFSNIAEYPFSETGFNLIHPNKYIILSPMEGENIASIDKVEKVGEKLYIVDKMSTAVTIFDTTGAYVGHVGRKGHGPGEYINIADFSTGEKGAVYILDQNLSSIITYDSCGNYISTGYLPFNAEVFQCLPDGRFIFGLTSQNPGKYAMCQTILTELDLTLVDSQVRYGKNTDDNFHLSGFGFTRTTDGMYYHKPIDDYVYLFDRNGILKSTFLLDFGQDRVPDAYRSNIESHIDALADYSTSTFFTLAYKNFVYGSLLHHGSYIQYIMDRSEKKLYFKSDESVDEYGHWIGVCGDELVSVFPPIYDKENCPFNFPESVKQGSSEGKWVLCFYTMKK